MDQFAGLKELSATRAAAFARLLEQRNAQIVSAPIKWPLSYPFVLSSPGASAAVCMSDLSHFDRLILTVSVC